MVLPPLGTPIPDTPHAVSVTLPTWQDNVGYEEGDARVLSALRSGYPRFVYHDNVKKLIAYCEKAYAKPSEACVVFPSRRVASECREFMNPRLASAQQSTGTTPSTSPSRRSGVRIVQLTITPTYNTFSPHSHDPTTPSDESHDLFAVVFPADARSVAKQFWQHSGEGVSTRFAGHCFRVLEANEKSKDFAAPIPGVRGSASQQYRSSAYQSQKQQQHLSNAENEAVRSEHELFVEERYGRNMNFKNAVEAKLMMRQRIAGVLGDSELLEKAPPRLNGHNERSTTANPNLADVHVSRNVAHIKESDVFLFPCGMSAIYNAHRVVLKLAPGKKSVQFGFPYIDTLKIQEKIGPGCHFLGLGDESEIDQLENDILPKESISAVFCEFPSNPLLRTPNLDRLRKLADAHNFLLVVDETVGNFVNVAAGKWADILVSSLTKIFSGDSNVMGGSAVVSPTSARYAEISAAMKELYEDNLWSEDAVFLERNSRTFIQRIATINTNAEKLCDFLHAHSKVHQVLYPKFVDPDLYHGHARPSGSENNSYGYGGLFSLIMHTDADAHKLFDALAIAKGPSLGTNFTLACPYTILAHYGELEWAASYRVPAHLIRVSVGLEKSDDLVAVFETALNQL
ncbi:hypothetical protein PhCBS80983_g02193 [Powellomyces hirtus]|uniref:Cystathionine gamma-synthase n=1 Tax=Powellomyces hirtus TaxID=109895 RepID=A0A507E7W9_9FUNG|nr:hypothetical protein PhCBS80983_g02193 [Powellomyces hirtus]